MSKISVTVPASTANLGPGFDCLALALDLCNTIELETTDSGLTITIEGEGADHLPKDSSNLCFQAFQRIFEFSNQSLPDLTLRLTNRIPPASGLGSSSAAIIGGALAADALLGKAFNPSQILRLAKDFEGHLDNAAAALLGGLTVTAIEGGEIFTHQITIPKLKVVVILPDLTLTTSDMRQVLPDQFSLQDVVFNLSHLSLTIEAFREGNYEMMSWSMKDRLHQPYRKPLIPSFPAVERAALEVGAAAVTLSGAGPALVAFAPESHETIAHAMIEAFRSHGVKARYFILPINNTGAVITLD